MKKKYLLLLSLFCFAMMPAQNPGNSLHFDGGPNHITANLPAVFDDILNNDITVEAQIRYSGAGFTRVFFAQKDANNYFNVSMTSFSGQVELYAYVTSAGIVNSVRIAQGLNAGQNHHIAVRWTAATMTIDVFIDGQLAGVSFGGDSSTGTNNVMTIGARTDGLQSFNGEIDELAIWNEARLLCLLVQDANEGINPAEPNLLAYYTFNQGVAGGNNTGITTLTDATANFPGTLQNFALSGTTSNFVTSQAFSTILPAPDTNPVALCQPPFTIQLDANGEASITVNDIDNGSFDPCGVASITIDKFTFTCADVGPNTVTLTITASNGNTDTCTTIVTVEDTIDPVALCVAPFTIQLDGNGQATITPAMIDNGSTDNCEIASLTLDITQFTCADIGDNTVTLTVTDTNGNTATCTTVVTVEDTLDPVAVCVAPFTIQLDASGNASITAEDIDDGSTASCGTVTLEIDVTDFTCADIGENTITLTVTDGNGNTATCTTIVTVEDNVAPQALCVAPFTIQLDANGNASITVTDINNGSTDACGIDTVTISQSQFDCSHVGDNTITLTVTDVNGNTSTCTTVVTVEDNIAPQAICVAPFTIQLDGTGNASITAADINNGSTDACGIDTVTISQTEFDCSHVGDNTITLTVTDVNGNTSTCTTIVTVEDNVAPEALCVAPFTIQLDANGNASITAADINNGSTDACGIDTVTISQTEFDCSHVGENTITLTVTDVNGNTSTCTTVVTVEDNVAPEALCVAPFTIQLDANGNASITAADINNGSTDACGIDTVSISQTDFNCSHVGDNTITLTVTDVNGNTSTCTTVVTVEDNIAPQALCAAPFTIQLDANGNASITAADINNGSTDACGIDTVTISQTEFDCSHVGDNTITLTVTDVNGNTSTCATIVTVEDNVAPEALCVAPFTIQLDASGNANITAADINNGSADACGIETVTISQTAFDCSHVGENTITLTVTDVNGNTSTCSTVVTVEDNVAPEAICAAPFTIQLDANGNASITVADIDNGSNDTCGIASMTINPSTFDCTDVGENTVTLTVIDNNGNTSTCSTIVTVEGGTAPVVTCMDVTIELGPDGTLILTPEDIGTFIADCGTLVTAIDIEFFDCSNIGTPTMVTYFATDGAGYNVSCTAMVTVIDTLGPVIDCPQDQTVDSDPNSITYSLPDYFGEGNATAADNCTNPVTIFTQTPAPGTLLLDGTYTITLTATDAYGNESQCSFELTVDTILGTDSHLDFSSLTMYPNPAEHTVTISNPNFMEIDNITVYDIQGRLVLTKNTLGVTGNQTLQVGHLAAAVYMVVIESNGKQVIKRLIRK